MQVVLMYCSCREQQHILRLPRSLDKLWSSTTLTLTFATEGTVGKWTTQLHGSQDSNTVFSLGFKQQSFVKLALIGCFIQLWSASWSWRKVATYTTVNCYTTVSKCTVNALAFFFFFFTCEWALLQSVGQQSLGIVSILWGIGIQGATLLLTRSHQTGQRAVQMAWFLFCKQHYPVIDPIVECQHSFPAMDICPKQGGHHRQL